MRRSLNSIFPSLFSTLLTPKASEMIASPYRHGGSREEAQSFFEEGFGKAFSRLRESHHDDFPLTVYYAFKQSESDDDDSPDEDKFDARSATASTGWETMLSGLVRSGFSITGTWPIRTERGARTVGMGTNALASSIVLVCRPRPEGASLATRKEFITALRRELPEALRNLQRGSIAPVDLAQAAIGPGMAVFTRYAKVHGERRLADDRPHGLGTHQPGARRSAGRAGRGVRRRHPLGAGVVRAVWHGRRPLRRRRDAEQGQEHGRQWPGRGGDRQGPRRQGPARQARGTRRTTGTRQRTSG